MTLDKHLKLKVTLSNRHQITIKPSYLNRFAKRVDTANLRITKIVSFSLAPLPIEHYRRQR